MSSGQPNYSNSATAGLIHNQPSPVVINGAAFSNQATRFVQTDGRRDNIGLQPNNDLSSTPSAPSMHGHFKNLDAAQIKTIESFTGGMDRVQADTLRTIAYDQHRDEDIIVLAVLAELVNRYFGIQESPDNIGSLMRSRIPLTEMIGLLGTVRFKDKNSDMILIILKQMNDNLMELLLNPSSFESQINLHKPGRSIINLFIFLIKNYFQQVRILKSMYCEDLPTPENQLYLFSAENTKSVRRMVAVSLELCMQETLKRSGANSAFQLHSQKIEQADSQPFHNGMQKEEANRGGLSSLEISNSYLEKNLLNMQKSAQLKLLSFEIAGSLRSDIDGLDLERALKESGPNMNKFVSSLLRKNFHDE